MLKPIVDSAIENAPSRYTLVIGIAKRARELVDYANEHGDVIIDKPVALAVEQYMHHDFEIVELTDEEARAREAALAEARAAARAEEEAKKKEAPHFELPDDEADGEDGASVLGDDFDDEADEEEKEQDTEAEAEEAAADEAQEEADEAAEDAH